MATSGRVEPGAERARRVGRAGAAPQAGCRWCPGDLRAVDAPPAPVGGGHGHSYHRPVRDRHLVPETRRLSRRAR